MSIGVMDALDYMPAISSCNDVVGNPRLHRASDSQGHVNAAKAVQTTYRATAAFRFTSSLQIAFVSVSKKDDCRLFPQPLLFASPSLFSLTSGRTSHIVNSDFQMKNYTSREAARKLGITPAALSKYIKAKKVPAPKTVQLGRLKVQSWTEAEVEHLRQLLPKIANGRKTRHQKQKEKPQAKRPAPHKKK